MARLLGVLVAVLALTALIACAPAAAAPKQGRWVAKGDGVAINFVVARGGHRLVAASPVRPP
jgi:hypothetical protein